MFWGAWPQAHALSERCRILTFLILSLWVGNEFQSLGWHGDKEIVCLICISATPLWYSLTSVLVPLLFVRSDKMSCKCRRKIRHETGYGSSMHFLLFPNSLYLAQIVKLVRYALKKKKRHYLGIFPKRRTPPHPPLLGTPYPKKNFSVYFAF